MNLLNISLDTLRPERFEQMTRRKGHDRVLLSIQTAISLGYDPVKVSFCLASSLHSASMLLPHACHLLPKLESLLCPGALLDSHLTSSVAEDACCMPVAGKTVPREYSLAVHH